MFDLLNFRKFIRNKMIQFIKAVTGFKTFCFDDLSYTNIFSFYTDFLLLISKYSLSFLKSIFEIFVKC